MGLPTAEQLEELAAILPAPGTTKSTAFDPLYGYLMKLVKAAVPAGASKAGTAAAGAIGVHAPGLAVVPGVLALGPIGAALAPWIGATMIAMQAGSIFGLHDILEDARSPTGTSYSCSCGKCIKNIQYIVDKKERNVGIVAVSLFTVGIPTIAKAAHSTGKKIYSWSMGETRPKERVSREIVNSARNDKCKAAMATIFLLSGSWSLTGNPEQKAMVKAISIMIADDGWSVFRGLW